MLVCLQGVMGWFKGRKPEAASSPVLSIALLQCANYTALFVLTKESLESWKVSSQLHLPQPIGQQFLCIHANNCPPCGNIAHF